MPFCLGKIVRSDRLGCGRKSGGKETKLAALQQEEEEFKRQREMGAAPQDPILALLQSLPPAELNLNNHPSS